MSNLELKDWIVIIITLVATLTAAGLSIYQYVEGISKDKEHDKLQNDLILTQKLLNDLQNETLKQVMGYGYSKILISRQHDKSIYFYIQSKSDYPQIDVEIAVYDQDELSRCPKTLHNGESKIWLDCFEQAGAVLPPFTLNPKKMRELRFVTFSKQSNNYYIKVTSKHQTTVQYSVLIEDNNSKLWKHLYRIFKVDDGKYELLEKDTISSDETIFQKTFLYKKELDLWYK